MEWENLDNGIGLQDYKSEKGNLLPPNLEYTEDCEILGDKKISATCIIYKYIIHKIN